MAWVRFVLWWMPYSCGFEACLNPTCEGVYVTAWINKCIKSGGKNSTQDLLSTHWVMVLPFDTDKNGWQSLGLKMSVAILRRRSEVVTQVPSSNPRQSWLYLDFSIIIKVCGIWGGKKMRTLCFPFYSHQDVGSPPSISWSSSSSVNFGILVGKLRQACAFEPLNSADERSRDHT